MSTKDDIIEAATFLFAEWGYEGMTMKEIANQVGIKPPSIYAFFKNKEDVFLHIYRAVLSEHFHLATTNPHLKPSVKSELHNIVKSIMQFQLKESAKMKIFIRILLFPAGSFEKDMKAELVKLEQTEHQYFSQLIKKGMEQGEIKAGDCDMFATLLICLLDGLFWQMQRHDEAIIPERFETVWDHYWQLICK